MASEIAFRFFGGRLGRYAVMTMRLMDCPAG